VLFSLRVPFGPGLERGGAGCGPRFRHIQGTALLARPFPDARSCRSAGGTRGTEGSYPSATRVPRVRRAGCEESRYEQSEHLDSLEVSNDAAEREQVPSLGERLRTPSKTPRHERGWWAGLTDAARRRKLAAVNKAPPRSCRRRGMAPGGHAPGAARRLPASLADHADASVPRPRRHECHVRQQAR
jgi:hypothetical protein